MKGLSQPGRSLVNQQDAALIQRRDVPRSTFHGSWTRKTAFNAGDLVPIMVDEILPGDHMRYNVTAYVRMATPLFPLFDNQRIDTFFFYVPSRILWDNFKKMMGEQLSPGDSIDYTVPLITIQQAQTEIVGTLFDHMGLPMNTLFDLNVNALPFRAYNRIWNDWFRDQNLQTPAPVYTSNGPDATASPNDTDYILRKRNKAHDYFTSALPWPQKFTAPTIPLGEMAPVLGIGFNSAYTSTGPNGPLRETVGDQLFDKARSTSNVNWVYIESQYDGATASTDRPNVWADLSQVTGITINTLREAWLVQGLLEADARGGTRYVELIKQHFGATSPDFRLQRPEYIGGGQSPLQLTPIAQTAPTAGAPVGALGAAGTAAGTHTASFAATEHGYIIGLINVRSDLSYQNGLHPMWRRQTRYDFYWPALAGLGEQAILCGELNYNGVPANDDLVFGYQERHHEYRTKWSEVTGIMRSSATGTLDAWHLAQEFASTPLLNSTFLEENPPMARVLAAGALAEGQQYLADILFTRTATRPIPTYGTPVALGRF